MPQIQAVSFRHSFHGGAWVVVLEEYVIKYEEASAQVITTIAATGALPHSFASRRFESYQALPGGETSPEVSLKMT
jgi:hypothetical protein